MPPRIPYSINDYLRGTFTGLAENKFESVEEVNDPFYASFNGVQNLFSKPLSLKILGYCENLLSFFTLEEAIFSIFDDIN